MFEIGRKYWFVLKSDKFKQVNIKGEILEENQFLVRIKMDSGKETIIPFVRILNVNPERQDETFKQHPLQ